MSELRIDKANQKSMKDILLTFIDKERKREKKQVTELTVKFMETPTACHTEVTPHVLAGLEVQVLDCIRGWLEPLVRVFIIVFLELILRPDKIDWAVLNNTCRMHLSN